MTYIILPKNETSLQLLGIMNLRKQTTCKFLTVVSEASSFVGNPVCLEPGYAIFVSLFDILNN